MLIYVVHVHERRADDKDSEQITLASQVKVENRDSRSVYLPESWS